MSCEADTGKGDLEGPKTIVKLKIAYTGCHLTGFGFEGAKCRSGTSPPGTIALVPLTGELTYASESSGGPLVVANRFVPEKGTKVTKYDCVPSEGSPKEVTGVLLSAPQPINEPESINGAWLAGEKTETTCGNQQLLFENGAGTCQHLSFNKIAFGLISEDEVTYKSAISIIG